MHLLFLTTTTAAAVAAAITTVTETVVATSLTATAAITKCISYVCMLSITIEHATKYFVDVCLNTC